MAVHEPVLHLRPEKERPVLAGHPWIFAGAVRDLDPGLVPGTVVTVCRAGGDFVGRGYVNPRCTIAVRMLTRRDEPIDEHFVRRRLTTALALRRALVPPDTDAFRLVNGEGDGLPGIVADVYGPVVVLQCLTAGAARLRDACIDVLLETLGPAGVYERSTGSVRREEGLSADEGVVVGSVPDEPILVREGGHRFRVDVRAGQKTGFFLDQRDNRRLAASLARGRTVLNAFAYTGAFSVYAGAGGARSVVSVESAARAVAAARDHWALNGPPAAEAEWITADVFRYLRTTERVFDLLILDPPALVKRRHDVAAGARAYKDLHLGALRRASPDALMLTFSCSQHVSRELFRKIVAGAAADAGREVRVLRHLGPGPDHPVAIAHLEGDYLAGLLLKVN